MLCSIISSRADTNFSSDRIFDFFFLNFGADSTDPVDTTRTGTVKYG